MCANCIERFLALEINGNMQRIVKVHGETIGRCRRGATSF